MARPLRKGADHGMRIRFSDCTRKRLEAARDHVDADSLAEVVRRAIRTYSRLLEAQRAGAMIVIRQGDRVHELLLD